MRVLGSQVLEVLVDVGGRDAAEGGISSLLHVRGHVEDAREGEAGVNLLLVREGRAEALELDEESVRKILE